MNSVSMPSCPAARAWSARAGRSPAAASGVGADFATVTRSLRPVGSADLPGVARVQELLEVAAALLDGATLDLLGHQLVVDRPVHVAEHADRGGPLGVVGQAAQ